MLQSPMTIRSFLLWAAAVVIVGLVIGILWNVYQLSAWCAHNPEFIVETIFGCAGNFE